MIGPMQFGGVCQLLAANRNTAWLGSVSFEERSLASLQELARRGVQIGEGYLIDYQEADESNVEALRRREQMWKEIENIGGRVFRQRISRVHCQAYIFSEFRKVFERISEASGLEVLVLDLSSLTKIHAIAAAASVATLDLSFRCIIVYSLPDNYGFIGNDSPRNSSWRDILIAPLADSASLFYESDGRGIVLIGHEAARLIVSLSEIEPAGGVFIHPRFPKRPDIGFLMYMKNLRVVQQHLRRRSQVWKEKRCSIVDMEYISKTVGEEMRRAKAKRAPAILFPLGPQLLIFAASLVLAKAYPESAWFVYPVPSQFDVGSSFGVAESLWFEYRPA